MVDNWYQQLQTVCHNALWKEFKQGNIFNYSEIRLLVQFLREIYQLMGRYYQLRFSYLPIVLWTVKICLRVNAFTRKTAIENGAEARTRINSPLRLHVLYILSVELVRFSSYLQLQSFITESNGTDLLDSGSPMGRDWNDTCIRNVDANDL